jgi:hypothetical protein
MPALSAAQQVIDGGTIVIGARFERPVGSTSWLAGVAIAVLAISGTMAIVLAIPPSIASVGDEGGKIVRAVLSPPLAREPARDHDADPGKPSKLRSRAPCAECGFVTSLRRVERAAGSDGQDASRAGDRARDVVNDAGGAMSGDAAAGARYEVTVRFRDGTTATFVEDLPRSLPLGGRVIVIGRSDVPVD